MKILNLGIKNKKDFHIYLIIISFIILIVFSLNKYYELRKIIDNPYDFKSHEFMDIEMEIKSNGELYTRAPLGKNYQVESNQSIVYNLLSYNDSWNIHRVTGGLIQSGRFLFVIIGIIFSNFRYTSNKSRNFKEQLVNLVYFLFLSLIINIILGSLIMRYMNSRFLGETEFIKYIDNIYFNLNVWKPGFLYNVMSIGFLLLVLATYSLVGYLIGTVSKNIDYGLIVYIIISTFLYTYPISPIYFLKRIGRYIIVPTNNFLFSQSGRLYHIVGFLFFSIIYIVLSYLYRIKKSK